MASRSIRPFSLRSIFVVIVAFSFAAGCDRPQTRRVLAQVLDIRGDAFTVSNSTMDSATRTPLRPNSVVDVGNTVSTSENGVAIIALTPGIVVQLNPNTNVTLEDLLLTKSSRTTFFVMESRTARIRLLRGSIDASIISTITDTNLTVELPGGTLVAAQTSSVHLVAGLDTARATVAEGEVNIRRQQATAADLVKAEQFAEWGVSIGTTFSQSSPVDVDQSARQEFDQACDAQRRFADLLSDAARRLPAW
jgi:hypothetical protein